jgi:hypothetical protein
MPTGASGLYLFRGLRPGDYVVQLCASNFGAGAALAGYATSTGGGSEPAPDPDNDINDDDNGTRQPDGTIRSLPVTLSVGGEPANDGDTSANSNLSVDFGVYPAAALGDMVWLDTNANGAQDAGEPGVPGVTVSLYRPGPDGTPGTGDDVPVSTTTTGPGGDYLFPNLPSGNYFVQFALPPGYARSPRDQRGNDAADSDADPTTGRSPLVPLPPGRTNLTIDAGVTFAASIGDRVWFDQNANGVQDAGEPGVPNVAVTLYTAAGAPVGAPATTDAAGFYAFSGLTPGDYFVEFAPPAGYARSPRDQGANDAGDSDADPTTGRTAATAIAAGEHDPTWDAGLYPPVSLGNLVWRDDNNNGRVGGAEPGIDGVRVDLYRDANGNGRVDNGEYVASQTTAGGGRYQFAELRPGVFVVVLPAGNFAAGGPLAGYASSSGKPGTNRAPGGPFEPAPDPNDDRNDDDNGTASGAAVVSRAVYVSASLEPANDGDGDRNSNLTVDFGVFRPASLGSVVWIDADKDGVRAPAEVGAPGVTVTLYDAAGNPIATTTTDANGIYQFSRLPAGSYQVGFSNLPGGYAFTPPNRGADDTRDSDADPATGRTPLVALAGGQNNPTLYAGLVAGPTAVTLARFTAAWEGSQVTVRWETAAEAHTYGFVLLRSATASRADAVQVTPTPILGRGRGGGAAYVWTDTAAVAGTTYRYWLVEIETSGARHEYGPATARPPG